MAESDGARWRPSIHLEDGADEWECDERQFEISELGLRFHSRLWFPPGTRLAVALTFSETDRTESGPRSRVRAEGIVVECEKTGPRCYAVTLLFLDLPEQSRRELQRLSAGSRATRENAAAQPWAERSLR